MINQLHTAVVRNYTVPATFKRPVLGNLINYYGLRQINPRNREGAANVMYMAAMSDRRSGLQLDEVAALYAR